MAVLIEFWNSTAKGQIQLMCRHHCRISKSWQLMDFASNIQAPKLKELHLPISHAPALMLLFSFSLIIVWYLFVGVHAPWTYCGAQVETEGQPEGVSSLLPPVGYMDRTQVVRLCRGCLYSPSWQPCFCSFWARVSCSPGWSWTCYVAEAGLEFLVLLALPFRTWDRRHVLPHPPLCLDFFPFCCARGGSLNTHAHTEIWFE